MRSHTEQLKGIFLLVGSFPSIIREFYCFSLQLFQKVALFSVGGKEAGKQWVQKRKKQRRKNLLSCGLNQATFSSLQHLCCCTPENPKIDKIPVNVDIEIGVVQPALGEWMERWGQFRQPHSFFKYI